MTAPPTVLTEIVKRFQPAAAKGLNAVYQLELTGDGGELWHLIIAEEQCQLMEGPATAPDVAVTISAEDWTELAAGRLNPFSALLNGRLQIAGDLGLASRLQSLFGL